MGGKARSAASIEKQKRTVYKTSILRELKRTAKSPDGWGVMHISNYEAQLVLEMMGERK